MGGRVTSWIFSLNLSSLHSQQINLSTGHEPVYQHVIIPYSGTRENPIKILCRGRPPLMEKSRKSQRHAPRHKTATYNKFGGFCHSSHWPEVMKWSQRSKFCFSKMFVKFSLHIFNGRSVSPCLSSHVCGVNFYFIAGVGGFIKPANLEFAPAYCVTPYNLLDGYSMQIFHPQHYTALSWLELETCESYSWINVPS